MAWEKEQVDVYVKKIFTKQYKKLRKRLLKVSLNYNGPVEAPIKKDDVLGALKIVYDGELIDEYEF